MPLVAGVPMIDIVTSCQVAASPAKSSSVSDSRNPKTVSA